MTIYCDDCGLPEKDCICHNEQDEMKNEYCPNCGAIWSTDEILRETCFSCGYPNEDEYTPDELDAFEDAHPMEILGDTEYFPDIKDDTDDLGHYDESDGFDLVE